MDVAEAKKLLDVPDAFSPHALKSAFRRASFRKHPDAGGSQEEFITLMQAFAVLKPCATPAGASPEEMRTLTTVDGTPLADLGKGYPLTVSARTCAKCNGLGYREFHEQDRKLVDCPQCKGAGIRWFPCKRCGGTGKYPHPRTKKIVGECYGCKGSGRFYPENKKPTHGLFGFFEHVQYIPGTYKRAQNCRGCGGTGQVWRDADVGTTLYAICETCKGGGEVKMANPVIPRGFLAGSR